MMSTDPSVLPPSRTRYSRLSYPCSKTDLMVASTKSLWLNEGVIMVILGQGVASAAQSARPVLSSVHGQPVQPLGGGGRSFREGHCMFQDNLVAHVDENN